MQSGALTRIKEEVQLTQRAVRELFVDPVTFGCRTQLRVFLQNHLESRDIDSLSTLTLRGQKEFLENRFYDYVGRRY